MATSILTRACLIAFAGILLGGVVSAFHKPLVTGEAVKPVQPVVIPQPATPANTSAQATNPAPASDVITGPDITLDQALRLYKASIAFVDARRRDEFEAGHVQNAYWMPADLLTSGQRPEAMDFLVPSQPVVVYCGGGECDASKNVAALLQQGGFAQCLIMTDGFPGWKAAGHPVATGKGDYEMNPPAPEGGH